LDYAHSFVKFNQTGNGTLQVTYHLQGAKPNTAHTVGVHIFRCVLSFGQFMASPCGYFLRDGNWSYASPVELGTVTTDQSGSGDLQVSVSGIAPGTYSIEFHTRISTMSLTNIAVCGASPNPCSVVYQSPGPFGAGVVEITIP
jgi:hypothetical protein